MCLCLSVSSAKLLKLEPVTEGVREVSRLNFVVVTHFYYSVR